MFSRAPTDGQVSSDKTGDGLEGLASLFCDIRSEWDKAEEVIKLAEQVTSDVVIPAIMELRYAGRRLIDALNLKATGGTEADIAALLEDARFSCHRARHDAIDAALTMMAIHSDNLARQAGYDVVHNAFPDFIIFLERLDEARMCIAESRRNRADRDKIYMAISATNFPALIQDFKALRRSRTLIEIILGRKKLGVWIGIIVGGIIAILGNIVGWYFWAHPRPSPATPPQVQVQAPVPVTPAQNTLNVANVSNSAATSTTHKAKRRP